MVEKMVEILYAYIIMSVLNPYVVYINSRDRIAGSDSDFTYAINFPPDQKFDRVVLLNALLPKSYYLIQEGYNKFELREDNTTVTITIPSGNYLLNAFRNTVSTLLTAASPNSLTYNMTYPASTGPDTGKWTYTQSNGSIQSSLIFGAALYEPFGFLPNSINLFTGTTITSSTVIKLQAEDRILIHSNCVNNNGNNDILVSINSSTSVNYSSIAFTNFYPDYNNHKLSSQNLNTISFQVTDENGIVLNTNGLNNNFTVAFYQYNPVFEKLLDTMKLLLLTVEK